LKPSNLLVGPDGIKLSDFGIASLFASRHLTVTGGVVGTAEYLSPEQAAGKVATPRSDLYSLGVVLYTLVTGRTPFVGEAVDLLHKHRFGQFDHPSRLVPNIPGDFEELICELLEKDPARRPPDAGVLARRLGGLRRRLEYKAKQVTARLGLRGLELGLAGRREGPATLMSRLMRLELDRQKRGGRVRQFLNRPWVLVVLFLLTVSTLVAAFWPPSPERLFRRGAVLMASEDPDDWYSGWNEHLLRLKDKYPEYRREAVAAFEKQYQSYQGARQSAVAARRAGQMTEPQWFYQEGLRLRQQGNEAAARRLWKALVDSFGSVPSERPWVKLAEKELARDEPDNTRQRRLEPVREAMANAKKLRSEGKDKEAELIVRALNELYHNDPAAQEIINEK
jgi:serine/threonine-protein kinase